MTPSMGASTGISIFMDSRIAMVSPSKTCWPTLPCTCHTLAAISARTSVTVRQTTGVFLIVSTVIGGLVIGAFGRLLVPGRQPIGCLWTVLVGIGGSVLGGVVARSIWSDPWNHSVAVVALEVLGAALLVYALEGVRRRAR